MMQSLELLAPARNLASGLAAIDHGADAVYIGASRFGARAAAGNSVADIAELCRYAHQYAAKVYVTVNTIIYDDEMAETVALVRALEQAGVDALLVQDMGLAATLRDESLSVPLHASTQTDNRTAEKVGWLHALGFRRVVLARELSIDEIRRIHEAVPEVELEVFVHGALCVSYSGVCYASEHCFRRSANRGACAQFCRMKFDLVDADGHEIAHQRHLLSLKDLCQIDHLEELAASGACSFKIEGRLKDADYVKNVVAAYSQRLDALCAKHPDRYCRASLGKVDYMFEPNLKKTFNRGYTRYFLTGRQRDIASFDTPKALGEFVGTVKEVRGNSFNVAGTASFANGDGLCFFNAEHELEGFRVNKAEGNRLFPMKMPPLLRPGTPLYRNNDEAFGKILAGKTAERKIDLAMTLKPTDEGFRLEIGAPGVPAASLHAAVELEMEHRQAQKPQRDNIIRQLTRLGNTPYRCETVSLEGGVEQCFIPSSQLAELRRRAISALSASERIPFRPQKDTFHRAEGHLSQSLRWAPEYGQFPYLYNIANERAGAFYLSQGLQHAVPAFEKEQPADSKILMQCRHCIRYSLGYCVKHGGRQPSWREPLSLRLGDGRRFRLEFKCNECQMNVYAE